MLKDIIFWENDVSKVKSSPLHSDLLIDLTWVKLHILSACLVVPAIWGESFRSMRAWCHIPCKHHPHRPKTKVWSDHNDYNVEVISEKLMEYNHFLISTVIQFKKQTTVGPRFSVTPVFHRHLGETRMHRHHSTTNYKYLQCPFISRTVTHVNKGIRHSCLMISLLGIQCSRNVIGDADDVFHDALRQLVAVFTRCWRDCSMAELHRKDICSHCSQTAVGNLGKTLEPGGTFQMVAINATMRLVHKSFTELSAKK